MNMLERAARASVVWSGYPEAGRAAMAEAREHATTVLTAALDSKDEALVEIVARAIYSSEFCYDPATAAMVDENWSACDVEARAAIVALKAAAQGGHDAS